NRIRIVHVSLGMHVGGMEKLLVEFARHADRTPFELQFISLTDKGSAANAIEAIGCKVVALQERSGIRPGLPFRLAQRFREMDPDVIHTHNIKPMIYAAPAARLARVPAVVHTRHGQRSGATRRQSTMFRLASRLIDRVVSVSQDSTDLCSKLGIA